MSIKMPKRKGRWNTNKRSGCIPDRWLDYSKIGQVVKHTNIVPIKVPLQKSLTKGLNPDDVFSPIDLFQLLEERGQKLGAIIDLTFTTKYYDSEFFISQGVEYRKVFVRGQVIPNQQTYMEFVKAIQEVEKEGEVICVHCTHGLNRSGYMICRYMIEELNIKPEVAMESFEVARGHKMERENYIDDLLKRCGKKSSEDTHFLSGGKSAEEISVYQAWYGTSPDDDVTRNQMSIPGGNFDNSLIQDNLRRNPNPSQSTEWHTNHSHHHNYNSHIPDTVSPMLNGSHERKNSQGVGSQYGRKEQEGAGIYHYNRNNGYENRHDDVSNGFGGAGKRGYSSWDYTNPYNGRSNDRSHVTNSRGGWRDRNSNNGWRGGSHRWWNSSRDGGQNY